MKLSFLSIMALLDLQSGGVVMVPSSKTLMASDYSEVISDWQWHHSGVVQQSLWTFITFCNSVIL